MHQGETPRALAVRIGSALRERRAVLGLDVADVAQHLRIRRQFLHAIEDGDFAALPIGCCRHTFVCAYADHLGFDPDDVARHLNREDPLLSRRRDEDFPAVLNEGPRPSNALAALAIVLAVFAYGVWQATLPREEHVVAFVAPVPERLLRLLPPLPTGADGLPVTGTSQSGAPRGAALPAPPGGMPADGRLSNTAPASPAAAAASAVLAGGARPSGDQPSGDDVAGRPPLPVVPAEIAAADGAMALDRDALGEAGAPPSPQLADRPPARGDAHAAEPADTSPLGEPTGRVYGAAGPSRVIVRARAAAWVQVRDEASNRVVLSRLLQPGDVYRVPDRPGMKMITGNAGGLDVSVDGRQAPPLGASGAVRQGIVLEADALLLPARPVAN